jgi:hypothetical protein
MVSSYKHNMIKDCSKQVEFCKIDGKWKKGSKDYILTSIVPLLEQKGQSKTLSTLGAAFFIILTLRLFLFPIYIKVIKY